MTIIARSGERSALTPSATMRSASMSRPESVSSRMHKRGLEHRHLQDLGALFLAARETDIHRALQHVRRDARACRRVRFTRLHEVRASTAPLAARLALRIERHFRNCMVRRPESRSDTGRRETRPWRRARRAPGEQILAVVEHFALGDLVALAARRAHRTVSICPEPFGPMMACDLAGLHSQIEAVRIAFPSTDMQIFDFEHDVSIREDSSGISDAVAVIIFVVSCIAGDECWRHHPTLPSSEMPISFCASTMNSIGSCCSTSRTKPLTISATASSSGGRAAWQ